MDEKLITCRYHGTPLTRVGEPGELFALDSCPRTTSVEGGAIKLRVFSVDVWKCARCSYVEFHDGPEVPQ